MLTDWRLWVVLGGAGWLAYKAWSGFKGAAEDMAPSPQQGGATIPTVRADASGNANAQPAPDSREAAEDADLTSADEGESEAESSAGSSVGGDTPVYAGGTPGFYENEPAEEPFRIGRAVTRVA